MDIAKTYGVNATLEIEGVWSDIGGGASVKVARGGNSVYTAAIRRLMKPHRITLRKGAMPDDLVDKIGVQAMAEALLLDWKGLTLGGKPLEYSTATAVEMLTKYRDFRDQILELAADMSLYQEEAEKN